MIGNAVYIHNTENDTIIVLFCMIQHNPCLSYTLKCRDFVKKQSFSALQHV